MTKRANNSARLLSGFDARLDILVASLRGLAGHFLDHSEALMTSDDLRMVCVKSPYLLLGGLVLGSAGAQ